MSKRNIFFFCLFPQYVCFRKLVTFGWKCAYIFVFFHSNCVREMTLDYLWSNTPRCLLFWRSHDFCFLKCWVHLRCHIAHGSGCFASANHFKATAMFDFEGSAIVLLKSCFTLSRSLLRRLVSLSRANVRFPVDVWKRWKKYKKRRKHKSSSAKHWETSFLIFWNWTGNALPKSFWHLKFC